MTACKPADTMRGMRFPAMLFVLLYTMGVQAADVVIKTDMFPEVVDYRNCRDEMLQIVIKPGGLLQRELSNNKYFKSMWKATATCLKRIPEARQEHMAALKSYADADNSFFKEFDKQLYMKGKNITTYQDEFPFKSLYFLLTDAMQLLNKNNTCYNVYLGTNKKFDGRVGELIRFGSFSSAKLKLSDVSEDTEADGVVFNITSCSVVNLEESGCFSEEFELLISPTEFFVVKNISTTQCDGDDITMVTLINIPQEISFDCSFLFSLSTSDESSCNLLHSSLKNLVVSFGMLYVYTLCL